MAAVALAGLAPAAFPWGAAGHETIGQVADALLNPAARREVARLLADDRAADGTPSGRRTLAEVASWADEIRGQPDSHPAWHYDNLPACGPVPTVPDWCPGGECATHQIAAQAALLANPRQPARVRNEALKWLVHLVGDIHQPLHAASNVYADGRSDRGGNAVAVAVEGEPPAEELVALHGLWDRGLVDSALHRRQGKAEVARVREEIVLLARRIPLQRRGGAPLDWARESNGLARRQVYAYAGFRCREASAGTVKLDARYVQQARELIPGRLALAGARLAALLNRTLDPALR